MVEILLQQEKEPFFSELDKDLPPETEKIPSQGNRFGKAQIPAVMEGTLENTESAIGADQLKRDQR